MYTADEFLTKGSGIVTLCGSTRFFFEAMEANRQLTFMNWAVFMCGSWGHSFHKYVQPNPLPNYQQVKLLHFQKILESHAVVIISDQTLYVGSSTKAEIAFAKHRGIPLFLFDGKTFSGTTDRQPPQEFMDMSLIQKFEMEYGSLGF